MLRESLKLIAADCVTDVADLAERLGVTHQLAEQMLQDLVRLGYLQAPEPACASHCQGCPVADSCGRDLGLLSLTKRGRKAASAQGAIP